MYFGPELITVDLLSTRSRAEYVEQLLFDIQNYYGYNEYLSQKLFELFSVSEVRIFPSNHKFHIDNASGN